MVMKNNQEDFISGIGNTPLIKLRAASEITVPGPNTAATHMSKSNW